MVCTLAIVCPRALVCNPIVVSIWLLLKTVRNIVSLSEDRYHTISVSFFGAEVESRPGLRVCMIISCKSQSYRIPNTFGSNYWCRPRNGFSSVKAWANRHWSPSTQLPFSSQWWHICLIAALLIVVVDEW